MSNKSVKVVRTGRIKRLDFSRGTWLGDLMLKVTKEDMGELAQFAGKSVRLETTITELTEDEALNAEFPTTVDVTEVREPKKDPPPSMLRPEIGEPLQDNVTLNVDDPKAFAEQYAEQPESSQDFTSAPENGGDKFSGGGGGESGGAGDSGEV